MLEYKMLQRDRRKKLALTGLTLKEFKALLPSFVEAYRYKYASLKTLAGKKRKRQVGGGRRGMLQMPEQKLFILVYLKAYPLQVVMGELFGMNQSAANQQIHRLLPVVRQALTAIGVMPEREGSQFAQAERCRTEAADYIIDGTERRRQRPKSSEKQALHYSGKKKVHSDKNVVIVHTRSKRVGYLSPTHAGKTHDKKVADHEQITYPRRAVVHKDTGFQGYEPAVKQTHQVKKSRVARS
ncbi:MAG: transposase family protein [Pyrinomonadaceae bacterium]